MTVNDTEMLQICQINISGLSKRSFSALDKYSHSIDNDVLAIQETLIDTDDNKVSSEQPKFTNMETFYLRNDRGVSVSVKAKFLPQRISEIEDKITDAIWILLNINSSIVLLGNFYCNAKSSTNNLEATLKNITDALQYSHKYKIDKIILLGDFNCRHEKWGDSVSNKNGKILEDFTNCQNFLGLSPNTHTFRHLTGGSVIDIAFVSPKLSLLYHTSSVDDEVELFSGAPIRGHLPVIHQFRLIKNVSNHKKSIALYKDLENTNWTAWRSELSELLHHAEIDKIQGAKQLWTIIKESISKTNEKVMPLKKVCEHSKPFWTNQLTSYSNTVRCAKRKMEQRSTPLNIKDYEQAKILFSDELLKAKNSWIRSKLENLNVTETKLFWKNYKRSIVGETKQYLGNLEENKVIYTKPKDKENILFKTFFTGSHMDSGSFDKNFEKNIDQYYERLNEELPMKNSQNIPQDPLNSPISLEEVYNSIKLQNSSAKSFDNDNFHPTMLKNLPTIATEGLCKLFNISLTQEVWPWDTSLVVFMKKEGKANYLKAGAYRPITISSYIGKLFERIIANRITVHCNLENILDDEQEGFRKTRNTTRYLYKLIANLKESQRKKFTSFLLCLDFEKAFDSVWLKGLVVKLHKYNINGHVLNLIKSFLFCRKVKLVVNNIVGAIRICGDFGVPQGSVLSPLLFILFISDIYDLRKSSLNISLVCKEHSCTYKYADDGSILIMHKDPKICELVAQEFCDHISSWCKQWKLIVNCDENKTECLIIKPKSTGNAPCESFSQLKISEKRINFVKSSRVLGLVIDEELSFYKHAGKTLQRCWFSWYKITRSSNRNYGLNISSMAILFKTVVLTKLLYAAPVWLNAQNQLKFKSFFARACLKISGCTHYTPQSISLLTMGLEPLEMLYNIVCTKFILKALSSDDNLRGLIYQLEESRSHPFYQHIIMVKTYLSYKHGCILDRRNNLTSSLVSVDQSLLIYKKSDIDTWKIRLWNDFLVSKSNGKQGDTSAPDNTLLLESIIHHKFLFPRTSKRSTDTKVMSLLHGHDLCFKSFQYTLKLVSCPLCDVCHTEKDDNKHQLLKCPRFNCKYRDELSNSFLSSPTLAHGILGSQPHLDILERFRCMAQIIVR